MTNLTNITLLLNRYNRNIELLNTLSNSVQKTEDKLKEIKGSEFLQGWEFRKLGKLNLLKDTEIGEKDI